MSDIIQYLNTIVQLSAEESEEFSSSLNPLWLKKGEVFLEYGRISSRIAFIQEGILEMTYSDGSNEKILDFLLPNSFATNYESFLLNSPSEVQISAIKESSLLCFEKSSLEKLYNKSVNFQKIGRILAEKYYLDIIDRIRSQYQTPKIRYDKLRQTNPEVIQQIPQYKIASYLDVTPEWLSKLRSKK